MDESLSSLRNEYGRYALHETEAGDDPVILFRRWMREALHAKLPEPNAMTLATVKPDGKPAARIVLLKELDDSGFVFYTNYESAKGQELGALPSAALVFLWLQMERQVRVEGAVERTTREETEAYFLSRPRASQIGAWASSQSRPVESREAVQRRYEELERTYADGDIPVPDRWGGFRVLPEMIEFWQGRPGRLHDRLRYTLKPEGGWNRERLEP